jgi:polar amino acid transport system substrate-binding protein
VTTDRRATPRRSFRAPRRPLAATLAAAGLLLLAACGSGGGSGGGSGAAHHSASPASGASPGSSAVPTRDVVSAIRADAAVRAELPASVRKKGTLTLGTPPAPGTSGLPHGGTVDGKVVGLDVDLRNAVAKVLGITWTVRNGTFPTIVPGVQNGKFDVGQANLGVTKEREQVVDFATYLDDGQSFLGGSTVGATHITSLDQLCGHTVGTSPGSTFQTLLTSHAKDCAKKGKKPYTVQYFTDTAPIFLGLANGKLDIYFGPTLSLKYDAAHIAGTHYLGQITSTPVGFVTARHSALTKPLRDAVDKLIADGDYAKIFAKWGVTGTGVTSSRINPPATF